MTQFDCQFDCSANGRWAGSRQRLTLIDKDRVYSVHSKHGQLESLGADIEQKRRRWQAAQRARIEEHGVGGGGGGGGGSECSIWVAHLSSASIHIAAQTEHSASHCSRRRRRWRRRRRRGDLGELAGQVSFALDIIRRPTGEPTVNLVPWCRDFAPAIQRTHAPHTAHAERGKEGIIPARRAHAAFSAASESRVLEWPFRHSRWIIISFSRILAGRHTHQTNTHTQPYSQHAHTAHTCMHACMHARKHTWIYTHAGAHHRRQHTQSININLHPTHRDSSYGEPSCTTPPQPFTQQRTDPFTQQRTDPSGLGVVCRFSCQRCTRQFARTAGSSSRSLGECVPP